MRVLLISHAYAAPINREKVQALSRRPDLEMSLLVPRLWKEGERTYATEPGKQDGYSIFAGSVLFPGRVTGHVYRSGLVRALRVARPDVIHLEQEPWGLVTAQVIFASGMFRPRPKLVLFSFENLDLDLPWYFRMIERKTLAAAEVIIAGGESALGRLRRQGASPERLTVLPQFGLDPQSFRPPAEGERPDVFTVGFIGRHVHQKGVDLLIRALAELKGDWRAIFIGDGPKRNEWEALARGHGIGGRIDFTGWVDHFEIPAMLRQMDVLVLPARTTATSREQFGHVLIEAMSSGVVPVGSDSGEIPGVIGKEGFIFPEEGAGELGGILQELRDKPELRNRFSEAGRERVLREYSWEVFAERTHAIYERAIAAGKEIPGRAE
ncbi:glycosyltransferase family 4 protein [Nitrospinota bacterium]